MGEGGRRGYGCRAPAPTWLVPLLGKPSHPPTLLKEEAPSQEGEGFVEVQGAEDGGCSRSESLIHVHNFSKRTFVSERKKRDKKNLVTIFSITTERTF